MTQCSPSASVECVSGDEGQVPAHERTCSSGAFLHLLAQALLELALSACLEEETERVCSERQA